MRTIIDTTIAFGREGNSRNYRLFGWSEPESEFTWTDGPESALMLPRPAAPHGFFIELHATPLAVRERLPEQDLTIKVNGRFCAQTAISASGLWAFYVPPIEGGWDRFVITFEHPKAARPVDIGSGSDRRTLGLAVRRLRILTLAAQAPPSGLRRSEMPLHHTAREQEQEALTEAQGIVGIPAAKLVTMFESLGDNCEFGLFQRRCGAEPLGLLRFSTAWLEPVIRGLDTEFAGLGNANYIDPQLDTNGLGEWIIYERQFSLRYHTFIYEHQATEAQIKQQESKKLAFLMRKLLEDVSEGRKIFVYKRGNAPAMLIEEILPLFLALNRHAANQLLWVVLADGTHPPGTVEEVVPGLLQGYIDRFAPGEMVPQLSVPGWLTVCTNAFALQRIPLHAVA